MKFNFLKKLFILSVMTLCLTVSSNAATIEIDDSLEVCTDNIPFEDGDWTATYYGNTYKTQRWTANGEKFNMNAMTCAAPRRYKFNSYLLVVNVVNGKGVVVKVTDRGAFGERTIDLTYGSFAKIATNREGRIKIKVYQLGDDISKYIKKRHLMIPSGFPDKHKK